eukprot:GHUV01040916.1.p1 GENE.GHUV01040916.1~~GHUV01040916.1.p1  ORF type:complete len:119 (+),score=23.68 GHUV01040916.1:498-854(+)
MLSCLCGLLINDHPILNQKNTNAAASTGISCSLLSYLSAAGVLCVRGQPTRHLHLVMLHEAQATQATPSFTAAMCLSAAVLCAQAQLYRHCGSLELATQCQNPTGRRHLRFQQPTDVC